MTKTNSVINESGRSDSKETPWQEYLKEASRQRLYFSVGYAFKGTFLNAYTTIEALEAKLASFNPHKASEKERKFAKTCFERLALMAHEEIAFLTEMLKSRREDIARELEITINAFTPILDMITYHELMMMADTHKDTSDMLENMKQVKALCTAILPLMREHLPLADEIDEIADREQIESRSCTECKTDKSKGDTMKEKGQIGNFRYETSGTTITGKIIASSWDRAIVDDFEGELREVFKENGGITITNKRKPFDVSNEIADAFFQVQALSDIGANYIGEASNLQDTATEEEIQNIERLCFTIDDYTKKIKTLMIDLKATGL